MSSALSIDEVMAFGALYNECRSIGHDLYRYYAGVALGFYRPRKIRRQYAITQCRTLCEEQYKYAVDRDLARAAA